MADNAEQNEKNAKGIFYNLLFILLIAIELIVITPNHSLDSST